MKESDDYRSKKALAIGAGIAAAVVVAVGGTVAFIKSRPASTAVNNVVENQITNSATANETNSTQNISINNEVTNTSTNSTSNNGNTISNTTANNTTNSNSTNTATNNASSNNSKPSATAQTGTNNNKNTNQTRLEEFVQSTVIEGKKNVKVYDERDVQWSPLALSAISGAFELNKSHIYSTKVAYINGIVIDTQESYVAHEGDEITYVIKVVNSGKKVKNNINAYDSIPKGTSLVADSITNNGVEKNGKISWKVSVEAGKTVELSFKVKVNKEITVVTNQATVNGEPTNEVKTPIVTSDKEVQVLDNEGNIIEGATVASAGQTLLYTIRVRNTSDVEGKANITDTIDDKAITVDAASITEGGNYSKGTITWNNVTVPAKNDVESKGRAKLQFKATVNSESEFSLVSNKAEVNGTPTNEVKTPIVTSEKQVQVLDNAGNVIEGVTTASAGQTLLYTIRVINTSNVDGKANISDTIDTEALKVHTSSLTDGGKYADGIVSWIDITIPANGSKEVKFQATINTEGEFNVVTNKAIVNDVPTEEVKTPIITSEKQVAVLDKEGNVITGVTTASKGQKLLYTIKVNNSSEVEGQAKITDRVDTNILTIDESSITEGGKYADGKVTWENVTVSANGNKEVKFVAIINTEGEFNVVTNKAKVNDVPTEEVKTPIVTSDKEVLVLDNNGKPIEGATVAIKGQTLLYTIRVRNTSDVEGKANITDTIDDKVLIVDTSSITEGGNYSNGTITWNNVTVPSKNDVESKGRAKLQFKATVNTEGEFNVVTNKAEVNGEPTNEVKTPIITATKTPSVEFAKNGDVYTYTIVVTNHSEISGKATISDKVPEGTSYVPDTIVGGGNYDEATKTITWNNIEVKPGTTTVSFNVKVEKDTVDAIKNTAKVNDHDVPSDDVPVAKVKIDKKLVDEDPNRKYKIGEKVSYVITVTNLGSKDLSNVVVKDDLTVRDSINSKVATVTSIKVGNNNVADFASYISQEDKDGDAILVITIPELKVEDKEAEIKLEYEVTAEDVGVGNHKIINTATVETTETPDPTPIPEDPTVETDNYTNVSVVKEWDDNNNQDGKRADSVFVTLKANGNDADSSLNVTNPRVELNDSNSWKYEWVKVLANKDGRAINYTVVEDDVTYEENGETRKYTSTVETINKTERNTDYKVINKHDPIPYNEDPDDPEVKPGTITVTKVWEDDNNRDGLRADVKVTLVGKAGETTTINDTQTLRLNADKTSASYTWSNLPKYNAGIEIVYTVEETEGVKDYTISPVGATQVTNGKIEFTNTHEPEKYDGDPDNLGKIIANKAWDDNKDQDGKRPNSITFKLTGKADGVEVYTESKTINKAELDADGNWTGNTSVTFDRNGEGLYKFANGGKTIVYTVTETMDFGNNEVATYTQTYSSGDKDAILDGNVTITNVHKPEKFNEDGRITIIKVWDDSNNQDGMRSDIEFTLLNAKNEDEVYGVVTLTEDNVDENDPNKWTYTWTDLDKYANGEEIVYKVVETGLNMKYASTISAIVPSTGDNAGKATITNTYVVETTSYEVTKVWNDDSNRDGYRADVEIALKADGEVIKTAYTSNASTDDIVITKNDDNTWTIKFNNLEVYKAGAVGQKVKYTSEEITDLAQYETETKNGDYKSTIINSHTTDKTTYMVTKEWDDDNNRDGLQAEEVKVQLYANGVAVGDPVVLKDGEPSFRHTWSGLEKNLNGREIKYTVDEVAVPDGYTKEVTTDGNTTTITNSHTSEKHDDIVITKIWEDNNNQDGKRPTTITFNLKAKVNNQYIGDLQQSKTISVSNTGRENAEKAIFKDLYKYYNGSLIEYYVSETAVTFMENGVEQTYTTTPAGEVKVENNSITFTNTHDPYKYNGDGKIEITKSWSDYSNQDGIRPATITVNVVGTVPGNSTPVSSQAYTITAKDNWHKTVTGLPKYNNGKEITYTITENRVDGYTASIPPVSSGEVTITNNHTPEKISVDVTKNWVDENNRYKLRPASIVINLYAKKGQETELVESKTISGDKNASTWTYSFTNLPKYYDEGKVIEYSITENSLVDYTSSVNGYTVTNTIKPVTEYKLKTNTGEVIKKPINYILVLDKSGSMNFSVDRTWEPFFAPGYREQNSRIENAETAVKDFVKALFTSSTTADDTTVTVVTFANSASYYNKYTKTNYARQIDRFSITAGGGTNIEAGLEEAIGYLSDTVQNAIILLSDGTPTDGDRQSAEALGAYAYEIEHLKPNTSIYTIAFGITADKNVLKEIATDGNVLASNSATGLIENLNEVQDKLTPGESHYTTNGKIETLYKGTTPLKKFSFTAKHKTDSTQDINQLYDSKNMSTGTNGVFTYTTSTNSSGETEYTLSIDFSQYLNNYKDFEVTYFVDL